MRNAQAFARPKHFPSSRSDAGHWEFVNGVDRSLELKDEPQGKIPAQTEDNNRCQASSAALQYRCSYRQARGPSLTLPLCNVFLQACRPHIIVSVVLTSDFWRLCDLRNSLSYTTRPSIGAAPCFIQFPLCNGRQIQQHQHCFWPQTHQVSLAFVSRNTTLCPSRGFAKSAVSGLYIAPFLTSPCVNQAASLAASPGCDQLLTESDTSTGTFSQNRTLCAVASANLARILVRFATTQAVQSAADMQVSAAFTGPYS